MLRKLKRKYWYPISVDIERNLRKLRRFVDKVYKKIWPWIFGFWVTLVLTWGTLMFKHDYDLIHNYAHIDALNAGIYVDWNTYGSLGKEPPPRLK
jgi:hypothetical protein